MMYKFLKVVLWPLFRLFYKISVSNEERLPSSGSVLLVSNHASYMDPVVLGLAAQRPIAFMARAGLFKIPVLGWLIRRLNAFPVKRDVFDRQALRIALGKLGSGEVVGIFPQGTRRRGQADDGLPGAALIAYKTKAVVLPAAIIGTDKIIPEGKWWPRWPKIRVVFGNPIEFGATEDKKEAIALMTDSIMGEIRMLAGESVI